MNRAIRDTTNQTRQPAAVWCSMRPQWIAILANRLWHLPISLSKFENPCKTHLERIAQHSFGDAAIIKLIQIGASIRVFEDLSPFSCWWIWVQSIGGISFNGHFICFLFRHTGHLFSIQFMHDFCPHEFKIYSPLIAPETGQLLCILCNTTNRHSHNSTMCGSIRE